MPSMKNKILLLIFAVFNVAYTHAQTQKISVKSGVWSFTNYTDNIIKINFKPNGYTTNENISDAMILPAQAFIKIPVEANGDVAIAGGKTIRFIEKDGYRGFSFSLKDNEKIFGGGERALPLNRRGYRFDLYNNPWYGYSNGADNLNFSVPFFTSSEGYALFFDNVSKGYADIGKTNSNSFEAGFSSGEINVVIIFGKDYQQILSSYYKLTGTQPLPPRWAMGNFMSRFGYTSEVQAKDIAAKMKKENFPFDAIIFDLFWFGDSIKGTMGNLDWVNKNKWPDPKKMIGDFKKDHINSILIAEPFILQGTKNYEPAKKYFATDSAGKPFTLTDFYFGYGGLLDIFRKDAGGWIWNNHYKKQIANGVTGWWTDLGEPEKHPAAMQHNMKSLGINRLMGANEVHNAYGHYWNKMLFENYAKEFPNQRLFHLNRSGFAGSQRYSIFPWSGDISRSWSGLQAQVPLMLGMSMSGIPYIHADAGGFAGGEGDNELYVRWLQYAAFTPIFRPHGTALFEVDKNAYSFPSEPALIDSAYRKYAKRAVDLRYLLLPYNYTLAYQQASKGKPLVAPLYYFNPTDTTATDINDEFMWGENMLVAPVLEKNQTERKIYLPKGKWYNFFDTTSFNGNAWINQSLSLGHIPAFVKEGSFIPVWSRLYFVHSTADFERKDVQVIYFPSDKETTGLLYNDDGISTEPVSETIIFKGITKGNKIIFDVLTDAETFYKNGKKQTITLGSNRTIILGDSQNFIDATINGRKIPVSQIIKTKYGFNKNQTFESVRFEFDGKPTHIEITIKEN